MFDLNFANSPGLQTTKQNTPIKVDVSPVKSEVKHENKSRPISENSKEKKSRWSKFLLFGSILFFCAITFGIYSYNSQNPLHANNKVSVTDVISLLLSETNYINSIEFTNENILLELSELTTDEIIRINKSIETKSAVIKLINKNGESSVYIKLPWSTINDDNWNENLPSSLNFANNMYKGNSSEVVSILLQLLDSKIINRSSINISKQSSNVFLFEISAL